MPDYPDATRMDIIKLKDREDLTPVDVPEWGCRIYLRPLGGAGRDRFEFTASDPDRRHLASATLVAECACDKDGNRLFPAADIKVLAERRSSALQRLTKVILSDGKLQPGAMEEALGNSDGDPADEPGSP